MRLNVKRLCAFLLVLCVLLMPGATLASGLIQAQPNTDVSAWNPDRPHELSANNLYGQSAILIDAKTGKVLYSKKAETRLYPASTTKILTALLALEKCSLNETVTIPKAATLVEPTNLGVKTGEEYVLEELIYALMLRSANDVSIALAYHIGGSIEGFAEMMNKKAQDLGCTESNFAVPHGLTDANHYTTVTDMAIIARAAMQNETFRKIVATHSYTVTTPAGREEAIPTVKNSNKMLPESGDKSFSYEWSIGMKTGYTKAAAHTYAGAAQKDGVGLIAIIFGTTQEGKWLDARKLFEYGFANYQRVDVAGLYEQNPFECQIDSCDTGDTGILRLDLKDPSALSGIIETNDNAQSLNQSIASAVTVNYTADLVAPIQAGDTIGTLTYQFGETPPITVDLVASRNVLAAPVPSNTSANTALVNTDGMPMTIDQIADNAANSPIRYLAWLLLLPVVLLLGLLFSMGVEINRRRKRRGHSSRRYYSNVPVRRR